MPCKTHAKKDAAQAGAFKHNLAAELLELARGHDGPVRLWVADEHRYGLLPVIRRCRALKGVRVHAPWATCYQWGYLYEALEIDGANASEFLFVPTVDKAISAAFLRQIGELDAKTLHLVIWDNAGLHPRNGEALVPANVRLPGLPPCSPELNPSKAWASASRTPSATDSGPRCARWRTPSSTNSPPSARTARPSPA
ncbi:MAG: transposase [Opitutaceae bacterium]|nr:transposase [Opitutaceae bacterium]